MISRIRLLVWITIVFILNCGFSMDVMNLYGRTFKRPVCNIQSTVCVSFDPDPDPEPFPVIDILGNRLNSPSQNSSSQNSSQTSPSALPDDSLTIVAAKVDIPPEEEGVFQVRGLKLERYFPKMDIGQVKDDYEGTDLEVIEWPGIISDREEGDKLNSLSYQRRLEKRMNKDFVPLSYEGDQSHFDSYACNRRLGTHIRVMGFRPNNPNDPQFSVYKPFYFAFGPRSFHREYIQPLYAPVDQLNLLAENHQSPECQALENGTLTPTTKLNHIHSFAFATNRLILGTHCGILILKPIDAPVNYIKAAARSPNPNSFNEEDHIIDTYGKQIPKVQSKHQKFIGHINRLSSNVCCSGVCHDMEPIAVAYSYSFDSTEEDLKRIYISLDNGESWDEKIVAHSDATLVKLLSNLYNFISLPVPVFVSRRMLKLKAKSHWGKDVDNVVRYVLQEDKKVTEKEAPPQNDTVVCAEIVSLHVLQEENGFLALCRTDRGDPRKRTHPQGIYLNINYAIFQFEISRFSPLLHGIRKSKRRLACTVQDTDLGIGVEFPSEPQLTIGRRGSNVIVYGCQSVLYHSLDAGFTFHNTIFYTQGEDGTYQRRYQLPGLDFPLIAFDPIGISLTFTFGDYYGVGVVAYEREFRIIVGRVAETTGRAENPGVCSSVQAKCSQCKNTALEPPECTQIKKDCLLGKNLPDCKPYNDTVIKFSMNRRFIPYYTNSGDIKIAVSLMHFLTENENPNKENYKHRKSLRIIDIPFHFTDSILPFFSENRAITNKQDGFSRCNTFAFKVDNREVSLDLGESATFSVSVEDNRAELSLGVFSGLPNFLDIRVIKTNTDIAGRLSEVRRHVWNVTVSPIAVPKANLRLYEDSFFGSNYDIFSYKSSNVILANPPLRRCHFQPITSVLVNLGCSGKKLVAHEDYDRPQCRKFFGVWDRKSQVYKTYNFTLLDGEYDEEMLSYWRNRSKNLFKRMPNGWVVEYDYATFGCPIQPYRLEPFIPDLRILNTKETSNLSDTILGKPFTGKYFWSDVLIEIFGQEGFTYSQTVREAGCKRAPLNLQTMKMEWKDRRKVIYEAFNKHKSFHTDSISKPDNIWQKTMHNPCTFPEIPHPEHVEDLKIPYEEPYEVMEKGSGNAIIWDRKTRKDLYFFLAIDIDQELDTYCDYITFFAVTLAADPRHPPLDSILRFFIVLLFLIALLVLGYYVYRVQILRSFREAALLSRLERGAWEILLRYEKYLHEVELHGNDRVTLVPNESTEAAESDPKPVGEIEGDAKSSSKWKRGTTARKN